MILLARVLSLLLAVAPALPDEVILPKEALQLLQRMAQYERNDSLPEAQLAEVVGALHSPYDKVRTQAIRVILSHRLTEVWSEHAAELASAKGTSRKLAGIATELLRSAAESPDFSMVESCPPAIRERFPLKAGPPKPPTKGDVPLEVVFLDMALVDSLKHDDPAHSRTRSRFAPYVLTPEQLAMLESSNDDWRVVPESGPDARESSGSWWWFAGVGCLAVGVWFLVQRRRR